jgi:drug/metabolite transporter (DMT)-like permease
MSSTAASAAERSRGVVLVAAAALCWSTGGLLARLVDTDPWTTVFGRSIFTAAFLLVVIFIQERGSAWPQIRGMGWPGVAMALCFAIASVPRL